MLSKRSELLSSFAKPLKRLQPAISCSCEIRHEQFEYRLTLLSNVPAFSINFWLSEFQNSLLFGRSTS